MTIRYVRSTSTFTDGLSWSGAYQTLAAALSAATAGDTIYVSHVHTESTTGSVTYSKTGVPTAIICANDGAQPPTATATSAVVACTQNMGVVGDLFVYGIYFKSTSAAAGFNGYGGGDGFTVFENCTMKNGAAASIMYLGSTGSPGVGCRVSFKNCTFRYGNILNITNLGRMTTLLGCVFGDTGDSSIVPTILFPLSTTSASGFTTRQDFVGCDFSPIGSGKTLFGAPGISMDVYLYDCKLNAAVTLAGTFAGTGAARIHLKNSGSANNNYSLAVRDYSGTIDIDTTQYLTLTAEAGAADETIGYSWKMTGNANTTEFAPLRSEWMYKRYTTTGAAKTATIEILHDGAPGLTDAECWIEFGALTDVNGPLATFDYSDRCGLLTTPAAQTTGIGITHWTKGVPGIQWLSQKLVTASFTPQKKGYVMARVCLGADKTVYINPNLVIA